MSQSVSHRAEVPESVAWIAEAMAGFSAPWALCGGWAVDAWLGRTSREHGDVDVSVFVQDQRALFEHLKGWQLLAHDPAWAPGNNDEWWDGERRLSASTHIHSRSPDRTGPMPKNGIATDEDGFHVEFYLDDRDGGDWVLYPEPRVAVPIERAVLESPWRMPIASPEVLLFFKSRDLRRRDKADFAALLPVLTPDQRAWLLDAIARLGHPWESQLRD